MKQNHQKSWAMAYCGIVVALCVALMLLGAVIPIAMFIAPAVAGFLVATVCVECGMQLALTAYAAVSLLALLFVPDKGCLHCNRCKAKCPYGLDTPALLARNYEDYKRVLAGEVKVQ